MAAGEAGETGEINCFACNKKLLFSGIVGRREECYHCHADVHCCRNCEFYDPKSYNECRETQAEVVQEKDRANFCDYFQLSTRGSDGAKAKDNLKDAAEALFKKS